MRLSEIGVTGQHTDVLHGGDVGPDGRLLSVAEIQHGFRKLLTELRAQPPGALATQVTDAPTGDGAVAANGNEPAPDTTAGRCADVDADWITVLAAHSGAGASVVSLAIADAAAADGHTVHLVEAAHPARSGLVAASSSELGLDGTGSWRRGLRGQVTIDRRARDAAPEGWPTTLETADPMTVIDIGLPLVANVARLAARGARCILVSRATLPGVRLTEQTLDALAAIPVVVAVLGPNRWPGEVTSSLGPRLRRLRSDGQVVSVPLDRHLEVTGPTHSPLPKSVLTAGRSLLGLIDDARPGDVSTTARSAPQPKGTRDEQLARSEARRALPRGRCLPEGTPRPPNLV